MDGQGSARRINDPFAWLLLRGSKRNMSVPGGSCESLMGSNTRIGREEKKQKPAPENNPRSQQNIHLRGRKSHFSITHTGVRCRVVERTQTLEFKGGVFLHCTLIGVDLGESVTQLFVNFFIREVGLGAYCAHLKKQPRYGSLAYCLTIHSTMHYPLPENSISLKRKTVK